MYIVGFNGPPYSGKDTASAILKQEMMRAGISCEVREESLSMPLRRIAYEMTGMEGKRLDGIDYAQFKETHFPQFGNRTGRQLMIDVSESFLKPMYGQTVMADMLIGRNRDFNGIILIRDCGFQVEVTPLESWADGKFVMLHMARGDKYTYDNDSREPTYSSYHNWPCENYYGLVELEAQMLSIYDKLYNHLGWKL